METEAEEDQEGLGPTLHRFTNLESAPRFYADAINVNTSVYGLSMFFGTRANAQIGSPTTVSGVLYVSPQMAKTLTCLLMKQLRFYEKEIGKIAIPSDLAQSMTIEREIEELESHNA